MRIGLLGHASCVRAADGKEIPTIRPIGDGTVQISIPSVPFIYCQRDGWETLVVKYDIGDVENHLSRPDEC
jgi:hypothetical protein